MGQLEVSIQFKPWYPVPDLLSWASQALREFPYDYVWMTDEFRYEDSITVVGALASQVDASVGTLVTFPWHNPLELAQRFATMSRLTRPGRGVAIGIGAGGSNQFQTIGTVGAPVAIMQQTVQFLRKVLSGQTVDFSQFPEMCSRFHYNARTTNWHLYLPPAKPIPVYMGASGPRMLEVAGREADGWASSQNHGRSSLLGAKAGLLKQDAQVVEAARRTGPSPERPFKRIYNFHLSVSHDAEKAWEAAKRTVSYSLASAYKRMPQVLEQHGLDMKEIAHIADAYQKGLGLAEAASRVRIPLAKRAGVVFAGTPGQVIESVQEMMPYVLDAGFDHVVIGVPLGPDSGIPEAIKILSTEVVPALKQLVR